MNRRRPELTPQMAGRVGVAPRRPETPRKAFPLLAAAWLMSPLIVCIHEGCGPKTAADTACGDGPWGSVTRGDVVIPYPGTQGASASEAYTLTANGSPVFVEAFDGVAYAHFAFAGTAHVEIGFAAGVDISTYVLSPQSFAISTARCGGALAFDLSVPRKLLLWDRGEGNKLFIFADSLEDEPYAPGDPGVTDIASYGVKADGTTVLTATLQKALDDVASSQGGVLYLGPGTYSTGSLRISSHTTVYLAPGATLRGTGVLSDYPLDTDLSNGVAESSADIQVYQLEFSRAVGSRIVGRGTVDMNGTLLRSAGGKGGRVLIVKDGSDIEVDDVMLRDPASWNTQIMNSTGVRFRNVKIMNHAGPPWNLDGIDPDSSQQVTVDDTFVYSGDDSFAVKSTGSYKGLVADPNDIVIRNSAVFSFSSAGLKIGTESLAKTTENVTFENDDVISANVAIRAVVEDGTTQRNNYWRAIRVEQLIVKDYPPELLYFEVKQRFPTSAEGEIESATLDRVQVVQSGSDSSTFSGLNANHEIAAVAVVGFTVAGTPVADMGELNGSLLNAFALPPTFVPGGDGEPSVSIEAVTEYATPSSPGVFRVSRSEPGQTDLRVGFNIYGSARSGVDYGAIPSQIVLTAGATSEMIPIVPVDVPGPTSVKTVRLSLENSSTREYLLSPSYQAVVTLSPRGGP
jgi:hypothetical protein